MKSIYGIRQCAICGTDYRNSHARHQTCSLACGHELRRRNFEVKAEAALGEPLKAGIERRLAAGVPMLAIMRECGLNSDTALRRIMKRLGIATRTPREAVLTQWANNPERRAATGRTFQNWARANPEKARAQAIAANVALQSTRPTSLERALMVALDDAGIAYEFQYLVGNKFLCDFAFPEANLIVEVDGDYWHRSTRQRKRDANKDTYLRACGYTVLRMVEVEITQHLMRSVALIRALLDP